HLTHDPEPPKNLHRPRRNMIALHARRLTRIALLNHRHFNAAPRKVHREQQTHRPTANDTHRSRDAARHCQTGTFTTLSLRHSMRKGSAASAIDSSLTSWPVP